MQLKSLSYAELEGTDNEWYVNDCSLDSVNLMVGRNATGKTRLLNIVAGLSRALLGQQSFLGGKWEAKFSDNGVPWAYYLELHHGEIVHERLDIGATTKMERQSDGKGTIYAEKMGTMVEFQVPKTDIVASRRRDLLQHAFLEKLNEWATKLTHYAFGGSMGHDTFVIVLRDRDDIARPNRGLPVGMLYEGLARYKAKFKECILVDMNEIGFLLEDIGLRRPERIILDSPIVNPEDILSIFLKERYVAGDIDQYNISQGMFRALSLIIQLNYVLMVGTPSCILIDDIGEGLDFERSSLLIKLLIRKVESTSVQLIMTTNDRFVMNACPLRHWIVLKRKGSVVRSYNYRNSQAIFDDFESTGLNNFDFFSSDFVEGETTDP